MFLKARLYWILKTSYGVIFLIYIINYIFWDSNFAFNYIITLIILLTSNPLWKNKKKTFSFAPAAGSQSNFRKLLY